MEASDDGIRFWIIFLRFARKRANFAGRIERVDAGIR